MGFKFEKLQIWQKAMSFGEDIYKLSLLLQSVCTSHTWHPAFHI